MTTPDSPTFERFSSGAVWESRYGYCRAMKIPLSDSPGSRSLIAVTGTAPIADDGSVFAPGDAYAQAMRCYEIIARALAALGAGRTSVFRSRMFVTDIKRADEFGRAHRDFFAGHVTALTMVGGAVLIDPTMLVEIEVDAVG
jgi:enamine deaminase RidA (YjgF/YER057c/UK114 family)